MGIADWRFKQVNTIVRPSKMWITPVVLNPLLERARPRSDTTVAFLEGGEHLRVSCRHTFSYEQFERQSIGKQFFCDPQETTIRAILSFALGRAGTISVHATVRSNASLTIGAVVSRALDTRGRISSRSVAAIFGPSSPACKKGYQGYSLMSSNDRRVSRCSSNLLDLISRLWVSWFPQMRRKLPPAQMNSIDKCSSTDKLLDAKICKASQYSKFDRRSEVRIGLENNATTESAQRQ